MVIIVNKNQQRPVVIDCANVACQYNHNIDSLGDGCGPVEAYKYWKREGRNVKVFVWARKIYNTLHPKRVMANIDYFEKEIPIEDRISIPAEADDDSYLIRWAVKKDAILVSNDLLRDHYKRLNGEELKKFNSWIENGRCGYIFVDGEFIADPNFQSPKTAPIVLDENPNSGKKSPETNLQSPKIPKKVIKDMSRLSLSDKILKSSELANEIVILKRERDKFNLKVKEKKKERDAINTELKEVADEIAKLKESRDKHNLSAQELKKKRKLIDIDLKAAREKDGSKGKQALSEQSRELKRKQDRAHKAVKKEAEKSNNFHDMMMEKDAKYTQLKNQSDKIHKQMLATREKSDIFHKEYILILYTKFRLLDLIKEEKIDDEKMVNPDFKSEIKLSGKESSVEPNNVVCERCGRHGHDKKNCFYNSHIDGRKLQSPSNM